MCGFDHFAEENVFGGMVEGYIIYNGERAAVLEIKTAGDKEKWLDENGNIAKVPENYLYQASLYATLGGLERIVFAVGFLTEGDYDDPKGFVPDEENFAIVIVNRMDISDDMEIAEEWFNRYILGGITPRWTEADAELVRRLQS